MAEIITLTNDFLKGILTDAVVARGTLSQSLDLTETPGVYTVTRELEGLPKGAYYFGNLYVERGGVYIFQRYVTVDFVVYMRRKFAGEDWLPWYLVATGTKVT